MVKNPKENTSCKCLSLKVLDSVIKVNKKYHPEILLEECRYEIKKKKIRSLIDDDDDFDSSSFDESDNEPESPFKKSDSD